MYVVGKTTAFMKWGCVAFSGDSPCACCGESVVHIWNMGDGELGNAGCTNKIAKPSQRHTRAAGCTCTFNTG